MTLTVWRKRYKRYQDCNWELALLTDDVMKAASLLNDADGDDEGDGDEEGATSHDGDLTPEHVAFSKVFLQINRYAQTFYEFSERWLFPGIILTLQPWARCSTDWFQDTHFDGGYLSFHCSSRGTRYCLEYCKKCMCTKYSNNWQDFAFWTSLLHTLVCI